MLGSLFFNIYINDLFIIKGDNEVCFYAVDTTNYAHDTSAADVIRKLETAVCNSAIWFDSYYMKLNSEISYLLIFGKSRENISLKIGEEVITGSKEEKLLGVFIDKKRTFKSHVAALCRKTSQKLHALSRVSNYVDIKANYEDLLTISI